MGSGSSKKRKEEKKEDGGGERMVQSPEAELMDQIEREYDSKPAASESSMGRPGTASSDGKPSTAASPSPRETPDNDRDEEEEDKKSDMDLTDKEESDKDETDKEESDKDETDKKDSDWERSDEEDKEEDEKKSDDGDDHHKSEDEEEEEEEAELKIIPHPRKVTSSVKLRQAIITGRLFVDLPSTVKVVRIFTSSTFTDTRVERNMLMEQIYPRLKTYCQERGYQFQVVDMRWGVRDDASDDHLTSDLCMKELTACQKLSTGPNFITFLSQKYGYRPFPPKIKAGEFEKLLKATPEGPDLDLLNKWWVKDGNASPALYLLQPISSRIPDFVSKNRDKQRTASDQWWAEFEGMQEVLRRAATKTCKAGLQRHKYFMSVTEDEITNGILQAQDPDKHCFWFKRHITDLADNTGDKLARKYMDITKEEVDEEALSFLTKLKDEHVPKVLPSSNIKLYPVKWSQNGIDKKREDHAQYLQQLGADFYATLVSMIERGMAERQDVDGLDPHLLEMMRHTSFAQQKLQTFIGRQAALDEIKHRITAPRRDQGRVVVLLGEPGCGKTSLMCRVQQLLPLWLEDDEVKVLARYVGTTGESSTLRQLISSLAHQMKSLGYWDDDVPQDFLKLSGQFTQTLESLSYKTSDKVVFLLDSLDQLSDADDGREMQWLAANIPSTVTLLLSAIPGDQYKVEPSLRDLFSEPNNFYSVPDLRDTDLEPMGQEYLESAGRTLQQQQMSLVSDACKKCRSPLFLKLAFDQASQWRSYSALDTLRLETTVPDIIGLLFSQVEHLHGKVFVAEALAVITASRYGVSVEELEDIMSLNDDALNDVYEHGAPPLRRLPPLLWVRVQADLKDYLVERGADNTQVIYWYHRQFVAVARSRYLQTEDRNRKIHALLAEFFSGKWGIGTQKPFVDRKGQAGKADRYVARQPYTFSKPPEGKLKSKTFDENEDGDDSGEGPIGDNDVSSAIYNLRKLNQLPYHLAKCRDVEGLKMEVFCNFSFLHYKICVSGVDSLVDDLGLLEQEGIKDPEVSLVMNAIKMSRDAILHDPKYMSVCLPGRLLENDLSKMSRVQEFVCQAQAPPYRGFVCKKSFMKSMEGGSLVQKLAGHVEQIMTFAVSADKRRVIGVNRSGTLKMWDIETGKVLKTIFKVTDNTNISNMLFANNDEWAIVASFRENFLEVWDLSTRRHVAQLKVTGVRDCDWCHGCPLRMNESGSVLVSMTESNIEVWSIPSRDKVLTLTYKQKKYEENIVRDREHVFLEAHGRNIAFKIPRSPVLRFFNVDKQTDGAVMEPFETVKLADDDDNHAYMCTMTSGGLVVTFTYIAKNMADGRGDIWPDLKIFKADTGECIKDVKRIFEIDYAGIGENMWAVDDDWVSMRTITKKQGLLLINVKNLEVKSMPSLPGNVMQVAGTGPARIAVLDTTNIDQVQIHRTDVEIDEKKMMQSWMYAPFNALRIPKTDRYGGFMTVEHVCVEDYATQKTVRRVNIMPGVGNYADIFLLIAPRDKADLKRMVEKLQELMELWVVNSIAIRVNVVVCGAKPKLVINAADHDVPTKVKPALEGLSYHDYGDCDVTSGLKLVQRKWKGLQVAENKKGVVLLAHSPLKNMEGIKKTSQELSSEGFKFLGVFFGEKVSRESLGKDAWRWAKQLPSIEDLKDGVMEELAMRTCMRPALRQTAILSPRLAVTTMTSGRILSLDLDKGTILHSLCSMGFVDTSKTENAKPKFIAVDEERVAVADGTQVAVYNARTGVRDMSFDVQVEVVHFRLSRDGRVLAGFPKLTPEYTRDKFFLFDLKERIQRPVISFGKPMNFAPESSSGCFDMTPDGSTLYIAGSVEAARYDTHTGKREFLPKRQGNSADAVAYSEAADAVITSTSSATAEFTLLHPTTLAIRKVIKGPEGSNTASFLYMSGDGRICATNGPSFNALLIYDLVNELFLGMFVAEGTVVACLPSNTGRLLAFAATNSKTLISIMEHDPDSDRPTEDEEVRREQQVYADDAPVLVDASLEAFYDSFC